METPHFPQATFSPYFNATVYDPAEDSFLLLDALENDLSLIRESNPLICLEVGSGSGVIITALVKALASTNRCLFFATDINRTALECTQKCTQINLQASNGNSSKSPEFVQLIQTSLTAAFGPKLDAAIDLLIFNPPYVPTPDGEYKNGIEATWAGGDEGRRIIDRFLSETLTRTLSPTGIAYLVVIEQNKPQEIAKQAQERGFICKNVITRKCGIEKLSVLRFQRIKKE